MASAVAISRRLGAIVAPAALAALAACSSSTPPGAPVPTFVQPALRTRTIEEFRDLVRSRAYSPMAIASGPNGDEWVTDNVDQDYGNSAVVEVTTSGKRVRVFDAYGIESEGTFLSDIAVGKDGALWITDSYNRQILRMTTKGTFTGYRLTLRETPDSIAAGPDKALWFTSNGDTPSIGRITTDGAITMYSQGISAGAQLNDIVKGSDGAMWFTESVGDRIGRITAAGAITEYSQGITSGSQPWSIAVGADGALWFTELAGGRIGRMTTVGTVTEYSNGITPSERPYGIAAGPHQALWFTESVSVGSSYESNDARIGRITTDGAITEYSGFKQRSYPTDIVLGADKNIWFVETNASRLGRVEL
jgi:streptogramin lyase